MSFILYAEHPLTIAYRRPDIYKFVTRSGKMVLQEEGVF